MNKRLKRTAALLFFAFLLTAFTPCMRTKAADFAFVKLEHYEVTKDKIVPGERFTLTLYLTNVSEKTKLENLVVTVSMPSGISAVYGSTSQEFIRLIEPQESVSVSFEFESVEELYAYYLDFTVTALADDSNNSFILRIPVGTDSPFSVSYCSIPEEATEGYNSTATVSFKVIGTDNVKNSHLVAFCDNIEYARSTIGTLSPGINKTHSVSIPFYFSGEHEITLCLEYELVSGKVERTEVGKATCLVMKMTEQATPTPDPQQKVSKSELNGKAVLGITGVVFLSIFLAMVLVLKKKK